MPGSEAAINLQQFIKLSGYLRKNKEYQKKEYLMSGDEL